MKIYKRFSLVITMMLILSLFGASFASLAVAESSKTPIEISLEKELPEKEKQNDKILLVSFFTLCHLQTQFKKYAHLESHYSYLDTNQLLRPPISI